MRTTFSNFAILASSLLVKEVFAAPVQERALYIETDVVMVTEEVTVTKMPDGSYHTGAAVAIGTGIISDSPVLFTESASAAPVATSKTAVASSTSSSAVAPSKSSAAVFIQNTPATQIHTASSSTPTTSSTPIVVAPTSTSIAPVVIPTTLSTKASTTPKAATSVVYSAPAPTKTASSSNKKRGLAFNDASLLSAFTSSPQISWAYNWGSSTSSIPSGLEYIPMLWGTASQHSASWSSLATKAIAAGSTALLGFNEPDYTGQANLAPADAAKGWIEFMQPFAGKAKLVSPAVTNGGSPMGLTWIKNFISACGSTCTIDAVAIHWYNGGNADAFKAYVQEAYTAGGNRPLWITEFQASGSLDEQSAFLEQVLPFLDASPMVEKYAYFMASDGILLSSGTTLSTLGKTFAS